MRTVNFIGLICIAILLSNCKSQSKKNEAYTQVSDEYTNSLPAFSSEPAPVKKTKDDFGVLEITQDGPGYEINLALDTGDENVNFTMDLPEQTSVAKQLADQDNQTEETKDTPVEPIKSDDFNSANVKEPLAESAQTNSTAPTQSQNIKTGPSANDYLVSAQTQFYEDNYFGALEDIENAIKQDDSQALSYAIKGSILYKLGNKAAAKIAWEQALALNPKLKSVELSLQYLVGQ